MLNIDQLSKAPDLRKKILAIEELSQIETVINKEIELLKEEGVSDYDLSAFLDYVNSLLLTHLVAEGQDHSKTNVNVKRARQIIKKLKAELTQKSK